MTDQSRAPVSVDLLEEEDEAAIGFDVKSDGVVGEALGDGSFKFSYSVRSSRVDISGAAMAAVHDKSASVHAGFGGGDEFGVWDAARPGGIDVGVGVEDGFKVLPFACIARKASI